MATFGGLIGGFEAMLAPGLILACVIGVLLGTIGGVLPGIGPTGTMALILPFVFTMDPLAALIVLAGIIYGSNFGNSTSAILLNIPGDPGALATAIEGHPLALRGYAGKALAIAALSSFGAAIIGTAGIGLLSPHLVPLALAFGPPEFFGLMVLALSLVATLSSGPQVKSLAMVAFGLLLTIPGLDPITGQPRFTFGQTIMLDGFQLIPVAMGLFAFGEIGYNLRRNIGGALVPKIKGIWPSKQELRDCFAPATRGGILGFFVGVLPGAGSTPAAFAAYGLEGRVGKHRAAHGTGYLPGVAAPESANNAAASGAFVPLLTLAIPGSAPLALVLATLTVLGARPGPLFLTQQPDLFWGLIAALFIASVLLLIINLPLVGIWARLLQTPYPLLASIIIVLTVAGVYSIRNNLGDVWIALGIGVIGYFLRLYDFPLAPALLGFVLGREIERNLRQSLLLSNGEPSIFWNRTASAIILSLAILLAFVPPIVEAWRIKTGRTGPVEEALARQLHEQ
jgi:putative tricarboxylic transport membrane protein